MKNVVQIITTSSTLSFVLFCLTQQPFANPQLLAPAISSGVQDVEWKDIIFTEIFPDPSPPVGLPPSEFIEILNRSPGDINLNGWQIRDATSAMILPEIVLRPGEYLILTGDPEKYNALGNVWSAKDFPSLNNAADVLTLQNAQGIFIDSLHYSDSWYRDPDRKNGGWSLELIYPENLCSDRENWIVSNDEMGGSPGKQNNMYSEKPDLSGPMLMSVIALPNHKLQLEFNESLSPSIPATMSFHIEPYVEIKTIEFMDPLLRLLTISLSDTLQGGVPYELSVSDVYDCAGNVVQQDFNTVRFGKIENAVKGDIVINEVLFNPVPTGIDFVEIRNLSDKFINVSNWSLSNYHDSVIENSSFVTNENFILQPYGYLAISEDKELLLSAYPKSSNGSIIQVEKLPPMNDDEGTAALINEQGDLLDNIRYEETMHSIFIRDREGVSLERTTDNGLSNDVWIWKSASASSGFATPGYVNSNDLPLTPLDSEGVTIDPPAFIPGNGQPDFAHIRYNFDRGGYIANVRVYDVKGRIVKEITNNEILGTEGALRWDGDTENGVKARTGYYMIWFEVFDSSGLVKVIRRSVAVAARF